MYLQYESVPKYHELVLKLPC